MKKLIKKLDHRNTRVIEEERITFEQLRSRYFQSHPDSISHETYQLIRRANQFFRLQEEEKIISDEIERIRKHCSKDIELLQRSYVPDCFDSFQKESLQLYLSTLIRQFISLKAALQ
jgi:hypothetical protein